MRKTKLILALSLCSVLLFSACAKPEATTENSGSDSTSEVVSESVTAPESAAAAEADAPAASAASDFEFGDNGQGQLLVTGYTGAGGVVVIPSEVDGKAVVGIKRLAFYDQRQTIETIIVPDGIEVIEKDAFHDMQKLQKLVIGEGIKQLPKSAINTNPALTEIELPDSLEVLDEYAILGVASLQQVWLGPNVQEIGYGNFYPAEESKLEVHGYKSTPVESFCEENGYHFVERL